MNSPKSDRGHIKRTVPDASGFTIEVPQAQTEVSVEVKDTNPKSFIADKKVPLHLISPIAKALLSSAAFLGATKYGAWSWRAGGARASTYYGALQRHMDRWYEGEELDDDGTPHLANALACICILAEAKYRGVLEDDRPPSTDLRPLYADIEQMIEKIRSDHGHKNPHHWTIKDKLP